MKILPRWQKLYLCLVPPLLSGSLAGSVHAQSDLQELEREVDIFSGILEDSLGLNEDSGLFGITLGGINSTYLHGQGIVFELRAPLANRRGALGLSNLTSTLQEMRNRENPFQRMLQSNAEADSSSLNVALVNTAERANSFYQSMMERISNIDYALVTNLAVQQAAEAARSLRALGTVDAAVYQQLRAEVERLRREVQENVDQIRQLENQLREAEGQADLSVAEQQRLQAAVEELAARMEPLRDAALAKAQELRQRSETARQQALQNWEIEVAQLEDDLYQVMCDYGFNLRALPDDEYVSIILVGLGGSAEDSERPDRIFVFTKSSLEQCQSGTISMESFRQNSVQYSY